VKITGATPHQDKMEEEELMLPVSLCPDPCLSKEVKTVVSEDDLSVPTTSKKSEETPTLPMLLSDHEAETEFDAFLLDAVEWL
jgi:hypothetical protein